MAEEYKHDFVDDYPYLVYCDDQKAVYTNASDVPYIPGGGGGGSSVIESYYVWNQIPQDPTAIPTEVKYASEQTGELQYEFTDLTFEEVTKTVEGQTVYGIKINNAPIGYLLFAELNGGDINIIDGISYVNVVGARIPGSENEENFYEILE